MAHLWIAHLHLIAVTIKFLIHLRAGSAHRLVRYHPQVLTSVVVKLFSGLTGAQKLTSLKYAIEACHDYEVRIGTKNGWPRKSGLYRRVTPGVLDAKKQSRIG